MGSIEPIKLTKDKLILQALNDDDLAKFIIQNAEKAQGNYVFVQESTKNRSSENIVNYEKFINFCKGICEYAKQNHIIPREKKDRISVYTFYIVKIDKTLIEVGTNSNGKIQTAYFCIPEDKECNNRDDVIFLEKVRNNEPWENAKKMQEYESALKTILRDAIDKGYFPFIINYATEIKKRSDGNGL